MKKKPEVFWVSKRNEVWYHPVRFHLWQHDIEKNIQMTWEPFFHMFFSKGFCYTCICWFWVTFFSNGFGSHGMKKSTIFITTSLENTPLKFNIAPKNRQSQKETHLPTIIFQGLCWISGAYFFFPSTETFANQVTALKFNNMVHLRFSAPGNPEDFFAALVNTHHFQLPAIKFLGCILLGCPRNLG